MKKLARRQNQDGSSSKSQGQVKGKSEGKECKYEQDDDIDPGGLIASTSQTLEFMKSRDV